MTMLSLPEKYPALKSHFWGTLVTSHAQFKGPLRLLSFKQVSDEGLVACQSNDILSPDACLVINASSKMGESIEKVVVAVTKIPRGGRTKYFPLDQLDLQEFSINLAANLQVQVGIWTNSELQPLNTSQLPTFWPKLIRLAPDCHVQNVQLSRCSSSSVVIQATKDIESGQELFLWFDKEVLVDEMEIPPYLSPANIRGGINSYICSICLKSFQAPNKLKIHIALKCETLPTTILWKRLVSASSSKMTIPTSPHFLASSTFSTSMLLPLQLSIPVSYHGGYPPPTNKLPSLIKNANHTQNNNNNNNDKPKASTTKKCLIPNPSIEKSISDPEAQLESIVSNMGKARNGHMCLYCGKLYSRKYGLKIHIRTHTGYKPLRCKICHRPFGDPSNLNKHIRLHSDGNTPYRCDLCNKVLVRKRDLERHVRSRHSASSVAEGIVLDCSVARSSSTTSSDLS